MLMTPTDLKAALVRTSVNVRRKHSLQMAAALSYYFVLSLFPALIVLSAALAFLPVPDLFHHTLTAIERFLPADTMGLVSRILADVISPHKGKFLSFGILGTVWAASGGFAAMIEALNIAYEVDEGRPFWKTRLLAVLLMFLSGLFMIVATAMVILGPRFGEWLAERVQVSAPFVLLWPYIQWTMALAFGILAVQATYFLAPNIRQTFRATLPGAFFAVGAWLGMTYVLGIYFRHFDTYNQTYGALGAVIALMVWLHWTGFTMLAGAELNAELLKLSEERELQQRRRLKVLRLDHRVHRYRGPYSR